MTYFATSTVDVLIAVTELIHTALKNSIEGRANALDIWKSFKSFRNYDLYQTLKSYSTTRRMFGLIESFLKESWIEGLFERERFHFI